MSREITIPYKFIPRLYQRPLYNCLEEGYKRAIVIWHRRCIAGGSHVVMSDGSWKLMKDIEVGDEILSWDGGEFVPDVVKDVWYTGEKDCIEHVVRGFRDIVTSADHRFMVSHQRRGQQWVKAGEVLAGQGIHTFASLGSGDVHDKRLAEFLGYMVTDGSVHQEQTPKFTNTNYDMVMKVSELSEEIFGYRGNIRSKGNGWDLVLSNGTNGGGSTPNAIKEFFRENGALGRHEERRIPKVIWSMDDESVWAFLGAVISCDGCIYISKRERRIEGKCIGVHAEVKICAGESENLAWDYYWLLRKMGVVVGQVKQDCRGHRNYQLRIWANEYIERLLTNIATIGKEDKRREALDVCVGRYRRHGKRKKYFGNTYRASVKSRRDVRCDTYDLRTRRYGCFIADGYVVHNSGKDKTLINIMCKEMVRRVGSYFYFFPTFSQGRRDLWDGMDRDGFRFMDHIPTEIRKGTRNDEMKITLYNNSIFQIVGTDNFNQIMGSNPIGCVFSEYALQNPEAYDYIRPILRENGGWAIFNTTPRGHNHAYELYMQAMHNPDWFCEMLSIDDTGVMTAEDVERERRDGMSESLIRQEFYVSWESTQVQQFITHEIVKEAIGRKYRIEEYRYAPVVIGVDCAAGGDDRSVIWIRQGLHTHEVLVYKETPTTDVFARIVIGKYMEYQADMVFIDAVGVGYGMVDYVKKAGCDVEPVVAQSKASEARFVNKRAQMWYEMREWLKNGGSIPNDNAIIADLTAPQYFYENTRSALQIESKKDMKKRHIPSTDIADALAHTFYMPVAASWDEDDEYDYVMAQADEGRPQFIQDGY